MTSEELIQAAHSRFDAVNAQDPETVTIDGVVRPKELVQAERLEHWLGVVAPAPSLALRLASRCQHLGRFAVPRSQYPEGRVGYLTWRKDLARIQADKAATILGELGADADLLAQVRAINLKQDLKGSADVQTMEDALCLSFLAHDFVPFVERYDDDKVIDIVQKTWRKMSEHGHAIALSLPLDGRAGELVTRALTPA
jgi:hypothetical protein